MTAKNKLSRLVAKAKTQEALDILLSIFEGAQDRNTYNEVVQLSNTLERYDEEKRLGLSSKADQDIVLARVNNSTLQIINRLPNDIDISSFITPNPDTTPTGKKRLILIILGLSILIATIATIFAILHFMSSTSKLTPIGGFDDKKPTIDSIATIDTSKLDTSTLTSPKPKKIITKEPETPQDEPEPKEEKFDSAKLLKGKTILVTSDSMDTFQIGEHEVTVRQYLLFCNITNHKFPKEVDTTNLDIPITYVSWNDAMAYCKYVGGRLPTIKEWEYAALGGKKSQNYKYSGGNNIKDVAWSKGDQLNAPQPIRKKQANELGLYDMSGNVREWCLDAADDAGRKKLKGGSWDSYSDLTNPRENIRPEYANSKDKYTGFRVVIE